MFLVRKLQQESQHLYKGFKPSKFLHLSILLSEEREGFAIANGGIPENYMCCKEFPEPHTRLCRYPWSLFNGDSLLCVCFVERVLHFLFLVFGGSYCLSRSCGVFSRNLNRSGSDLNRFGTEMGILGLSLELRSTTNGDLRSSVLWTGVEDDDVGSGVFSKVLSFTAVATGFPTLQGT